MSKRRNAKSDKKAAREDLRQDAQDSEVPETYNRLLDVSTLDAKFAESPTIGTVHVLHSKA